MVWPRQQWIPQNLSRAGYGEIILLDVRLAIELVTRYL
jgi:hypothetical protein